MLRRRAPQSHPVHMKVVEKTGKTLRQTQVFGFISSVFVER